MDCDLDQATESNLTRIAPYLHRLSHLGLNRDVNCDSVPNMDDRDITYTNGLRPEVAMSGNPVKLWACVVLVLALAGLGIAGPWGVLAWYENTAALDARQHEVALLKEEIAALQNRVDLLAPDRVDSDLVGELARRNLGVLHPDEVVITLPED